MNIVGLMLVAIFVGSAAASLLLIQSYSFAVVAVGYILFGLCGFVMAVSLEVWLRK